MSLYCQKYSSLSHKWSLGPFIILTCCVDINNHPHTAGDVILFTFRYWAVRYPHYIHSRNSTSIWMLISFVWVMSIIVSLAPLLGWKDENWSENVKDGKCMVILVTDSNGKRCSGEYVIILNWGSRKDGCSSCWSCLIKFCFVFLHLILFPPQTSPYSAGGLMEIVNGVNFEYFDDIYRIIFTVEK